MLCTGIRAQVGVKIYGDNLNITQRKAFDVEKLINEIHGAAGVSPSRAEVMKPLATLEIGGMISSLLHILIVTPAIFLWLFERQLRKSIHDKDEQDRRSLDLSSTEASRS